MKIKEAKYILKCKNKFDKKMWNASRFCVSSLRRGHANLLCIVPIFTDDHRSGSYLFFSSYLFICYLDDSSKTTFQDEAVPSQHSSY